MEDLQGNRRGSLPCRSLVAVLELQATLPKGRIDTIACNHEDKAVKSCR